jgi:hypothetical protein
MQFWKCISSFRKMEKNSVELNIDGNYLSHPHEVAEASADHLKTVFINPYMVPLLLLGPLIVPLPDLLNILTYDSAGLFSATGFDFSNVFDLVTCALFLHLSAAYISQFHCYFTNRISHVCYCRMLPSP